MYTIRAESRASKYPGCLQNVALQRHFDILQLHIDIWQRHMTYSAGMMYFKNVLYWKYIFYAL